MSEQDEEFAEQFHRDRRVHGGEIDRLDDDQLARLCAALLPEGVAYTPPPLPAGARITPAEVVGVVKQGLGGGDPRPDLDALISGTLTVAPAEGEAYPARSKGRGPRTRIKRSTGTDPFAALAAEASRAFPTPRG